MTNMRLTDRGWRRHKASATLRSSRGFDVGANGSVMRWERCEVMDENERVCGVKEARAYATLEQEKSEAAVAGTLVDGRDVSFLLRCRELDNKINSVVRQESESPQRSPRRNMCERGPRYALNDNSLSPVREAKFRVPQYAVNDNSVSPVRDAKFRAPQYALNDNSLSPVREKNRACGPQNAKNDYSVSPVREAKFRVPPLPLPPSPVSLLESLSPKKRQVVLPPVGVAVQDELSTAEFGRLEDFSARESVAAAKKFVEPVMSMKLCGGRKKGGGLWGGDKNMAKMTNGLSKSAWCADSCDKPMAPCGKPMDSPLKKLRTRKLPPKCVSSDATPRQEVENYCSEWNLDALGGLLDEPPVTQGYIPCAVMESGASKPKKVNLRVSKRLK